MRNFRRVFDMMGKKRYLFFLSVVVTSASSISVGIINSMIYKNIVNSVFEKQVDLFNIAIKLGFISLGLVCIITPFTSYFSMYLCHKTSYEIRSNLFLHMMKLPMKYFNNCSGGSILSKISNDFNRLKSIYERELYGVISLIMSGGISLITIIILDWRLAIVIVILGFIALFINVLYVKPVRQYSVQIQSKLSKLSQCFVDICFGNRTAKLYNLQGIVCRKFLKENEAVFQENVNISKKEAHRDGVNYMYSGISFMGILGVGALMIKYKTIDPGTVIAIFSLKANVEELFVGIGNSITNLQKSLAGAKRVLEFMDENIEEEELQEYGITSKNADNIITLKDVSFGYDEKNKVIDGIDINIKKCESIGLVGVSGSGKSTILKLIMGIYKPQGGKILINGEKDSSISLSELREKIAYVSQEAYLFDASIRENIVLGDDNITEENIIQSSKMTGSYDFIMKSEDQYHTRVGENSSKLSVGERRRLALTRAVIRNKPILLLDEVTSGVDRETADKIFNEIYKQEDGITKIICTHNLSVLEKVNRIIVMDEGKIVGIGNHHELLEKNKKYRELYHAQLKVV